MTQRRRIPFILLAALAMVFALATSVLAAGELNIKCDDKNDVDFTVGAEFSLEVKSSGTSSYATGMVDVEFDPDVFELTNIKFNTSIAPNNATYLAEDKVNEIVGGEGGTTAEQAEQFMAAAKARTEGTPVVVTAGQFRVDFGDDLAPQNFTANNDDVLFTLTFKIKDNTKEGPFTITLDALDEIAGTSYLDAEGKPIDAVNLGDGTVKKGSGSTVKVTITNYTNGVASITIGDKTNVVDETVTATSGDLSVLTVKSKEDVACKVGYLDGDKYIALTNKTVSEGEHRFEIPVGISDLVVIMKGDTKPDGKIRSQDARLALTGASKPIDPLAFFAGDLDNSGKIRSNEARKILTAAKKNTLEW